MKEEIKDKQKREKIQVIFLILMVVAIVSLISAIVVVLKNAQMFKDNPIAMGINAYGFNYCMCELDGKLTEVNREGFVLREEIEQELEFKIG